MRINIFEGVAEIQAQVIAGNLLSGLDQVRGLSNQCCAAKADMRMPSCATPGTTIRVQRHGTPSFAASA